MCGLRILAFVAAMLVGAGATLAQGRVSLDIGINPEPMLSPEVYTLEPGRTDFEITPNVVFGDAVPAGEVTVTFRDPTGILEKHADYKGDITNGTLVFRGGRSVSNAQAIIGLRAEVNATLGSMHRVPIEMEIETPTLTYTKTV